MQSLWHGSGESPFAARPAHLDEIALEDEVDTCGQRQRKDNGQMTQDKNGRRGLAASSNGRWEHPNGTIRAQLCEQSRAKGGAQSGRKWVHGAVHCAGVCGAFKSLNTRVFRVRTARVGQAEDFVNPLDLPCVRNLPGLEFVLQPEGGGQSAEAGAERSGWGLAMSAKTAERGGARRGGRGTGVL